MRLLPILFLLLGTACASAQIEIKVEKRVRLEAPTGFNLYVWNAPNPLVPEQQGSTLLVDGPAGTYRVTLIAVKLTIVDGEIVTEQQNGFVDITLGNPEPGPEPGPGPGPGPSPGPDAPFPAPGLSVVIVAEAGEIGNLPKGQRAIFSDGAFRAWLNDVTDGRSRLWDDDLTDLGNAPQVMQDAYKVAKEDMDGAWVVISNGKSGVSVALPESVDALKKLIEEYK